MKKDPNISLSETGNQLRDDGYVEWFLRSRHPWTMLTISFRKPTTSAWCPSAFLYLMTTSWHLRLCTNTWTWERRVLPTTEWLHLLRYTKGQNDHLRRLQCPTGVWRCNMESTNRKRKLWELQWHKQYHLSVFYPTEDATRGNLDSNNGTTWTIPFHDSETTETSSSQASVSGTNDCWTDHRLLMSKHANAHASNHQRHGNLTRKNCLIHGQGIHSDSPTSSYNAQQITEEWRSIRKTMYKASKETIGHTKRHQQDWFEQNDPEIT